MATATIDPATAAPADTTTPPAPVIPLVEVPRPAGFDDFFEISTSVSWFTRQRKVRGEQADAMLAVASASGESVGITRTLLNSKHPAVTGCNAARRDLDRVIQRYSIARIALMEASVSDSSSTAVEPSVVGSRRLIRRDLLPRFYADFNIAKSSLAQAVDVLHRAMPEIKEAERVRQGKLFNDSDYDVDVRTLVKVAIRVSEAPAAISPDLRRLSPELYAREQALLVAERELTIQSFVEDFASRMGNYVRAFARQLGPKQKVYPVSTEHSRFVGAVVVRVDTNIDDDTIPEGQIQVVLQPDDGKAEDRLTVGPLTQAEFDAAWRPRQTQERHRVREDTVDNIKDLFDQFWIKSSVFGPYQDRLAPLVEKAQHALTELAGDRDTATVVRRVRTSPDLRRSVGHVMETLGRALGEATAVVRTDLRNVIPDVLGGE